MIVEFDQNFLADEVSAGSSGQGSKPAAHRVHFAHNFTIHRNLSSPFSHPFHLSGDGGAACVQCSPCTRIPTAVPLYSPCRWPSLCGGGLGVAQVSDGRLHGRVSPMAGVPTVFASLRTFSLPNIRTIQSISTRDSSAERRLSLRRCVTRASLDQNEEFACGKKSTCCATSDIGHSSSAALRARFQTLCSIPRAVCAYRSAIARCSQPKRSSSLALPSLLRLANRLHKLL
jgi:hypothetical protein